MIEDLLALGFTRNEAIVYAELCQQGTCTASEIATKTNLHRSVVYDNLERLSLRSLINKVHTNNQTKFFVNNSSALIEQIQLEKIKLHDKLAIAKRLSETISQQQNFSKSETSLSKGTQAVRAIYKKILLEKEYFAFGAPLNAVTIMGTTFWDNIDVKTKDAGIAVKLLFNKSMYDIGTQMNKKYKNISVRFTENEFEYLTQTIIYGDSVAVIVWSQIPIVIEINDTAVFESYKHFFKLLWKQSLKHSR